MIAEIQIKSNYGAEAIYPINDVAKKFAEIAGTKTLTRRLIGQMKELGVSFKIVSDEVEI